MGSFFHKAAIVTSDHPSSIEKAHRAAVDRFGCLVSVVVLSPVNGWRSFLIGPSGSKEGWAEQEAHVEMLRQYLHWVTRYNGGSGQWVDALVVQYGPDVVGNDMRPKVVAWIEDDGAANRPEDHIAKG